LRNLVIVAGHAIVRDFNRLEDDQGWFLLDFQQGEPRCYIDHIQVGVAAAAQDPESLLIFSGGQSRAEAGPRSEAFSYYAVADQRGWFGHRPPTAITEEFSRDSFENFLFSIARFKEFAGAYPEHVTFVSWMFKQERFGLHRQAVRWPRERFQYLGVNNPPRLQQALAAEAHTMARYLADPYSGSPGFQAKRAERNPFRRQHGYGVSCPELQALFDHQGPEPFPGPLPWG
jgi:hypothetical protein